MRSVLWWATIGGLAWATACRSAPPEGRFACTTDGECPPSMRCFSGLCRSSAVDGSIAPDAGSDASRLDGSFAGDSAPADAGSPCGEPGSRPRLPVVGPITTDTTWTCDLVYVLAAPIDVHAELTIGAGTHVEADAGGALIVHGDGRLEAAGDAAAPIVFRPRGTVWGGVALLGDAPSNEGTNAPFPGGAAAVYGGSDRSHDCGSFRYVRIERPGEVFAGLDEERYAGLMLAGCGSGTQVSHVQVHLSAGDGIEILGGTVALDHVIVSGAAEDGIDWSYGWVGGIQFLVVQQWAISRGQALGGANDPEAPGATPQSAPSFFNVTLIGSTSSQPAALIEHGSYGEIANAIITNFTGFAINTHGDQTYTGVAMGLVTLHDAIFWQIGPDGMTYASPTDPNDHDAIDDPIHPVDPDLTSVSIPLDATPRLETSPSNTLTGVNPRLPFVTSATFLGAMRFDEDWSVGWTAYPP